MSSNCIEWSGLQELRAALRNLPADLTEDAVQIVEDAAEHTAASIKQSYPIGDTGNLRAGVTVTTEVSPFGVVITVKSRSPHAHLWEFGTEIRATRQGWNRGQSPSHHREGLIPIAVRNRRHMHGQLIELVKIAGFEVSGSV